MAGRALNHLNNHQQITAVLSAVDNNQEKYRRFTYVDSPKVKMESEYNLNIPRYVDIFRNWGYKQEQLADVRKLFGGINNIVKF